jgi:hypothetical protein
MKSNNDKNLVYNYVVNVLDGGFFGFALGFASFTTIIPVIYFDTNRFCNTDRINPCVSYGRLAASTTIYCTLDFSFTALQTLCAPGYHS